jgi:hypothetical protein
MAAADRLPGLVAESEQAPPPPGAEPASASPAQGSGPLAWPWDVPLC